MRSSYLFKMRCSLVNMMCCVMLASVRLANGDHVTEAAHSSPDSHAPAVYHPRMSCYACTTMDYESSTDNVCRSLRPHNRSPPNLHQQPGNGHLHYAHQQGPATTTTTTTFATTTTNDNAGNYMSGKSSLIPSAYPDSSTMSSYSNSHHHHHSQSSLGHPDDSKFVNSQQAAYTTTLTPLATSAASTSAMQESQHSSGSGGKQLIGNNRTMLPSNYIRTRPCLADENFCSIVSVVRIEFVQDNIYSKFWALERNCSKSCNTGCMVIGERVRLRVCSQCCRTPNCNVGSGAAKSPLAQLRLNHWNHISYMLAGVLFGLVVVFAGRVDEEFYWKQAPHILRTGR